MADVEHHWHDPTSGQVHKAMYQYLKDIDVQKQIMELVDKRVQEAVYKRVSDLIGSGHFQTVLTDAVVQYIVKEKASFDREGGYGFHNRLRYLIEEKLKEVLLQQYKISVTPK